MLWKEIKTWATKQGYNVSKSKDSNEYTWSKLDSNNSSDSGVANSVSKLARAIFNNLTDNRWVDHQIKHDENFTPKVNELTNYGS